MCRSVKKLYTWYFQRKRQEREELALYRSYAYSAPIHDGGIDFALRLGIMISICGFIHWNGSNNSNGVHLILRRFEASSCHSPWVRNVLKKEDL